MDKQEKIVCAAVKFNIANENNESINREDIVLCINYHDNLHEDAIFKFENSTYIYIVKQIYGFYTSKNRFVDAKEAMKIAVSCGQVKNDFMLLSDPPQYPDLKPSDLY